MLDKGQQRDKTQWPTDDCSDLQDSFIMCLLIGEKAVVSGVLFRAVKNIAALCFAFRSLRVSFRVKQILVQIYVLLVVVLGRLFSFCIHTKDVVLPSWVVVGVYYLSWQ